MRVSVLLGFTAALMGAAFVGVFILQMYVQRMSIRRVPVRRSDGRGGLMRRLAGAIVMGLGRLTIAILKTFEKLGVDMSAFDEALARLTAFTATQVSGLKGAQQTIADQKAQIDSLIANDATQDQIDIAEAVKTALDEAAAAINAATDNLENPPADTVPEDPTPPADPGPVVDPTSPTPPVVDPPVDPPVISDPGLPGPPNDPPSGDTPVDETPVVPDAPVESEFNPIPADAPVAPVTEDPAAGSGQ